MSTTARTAVVVFTRDLRVVDNPALAAACAEAERVLPLFVVDDSIASRAGANRIGFLADCLRDLDGSLRARGGRLVVAHGGWVDAVIRCARSVSADAIHLSADVSAHAQQRSARLRRDAGALGVEVREHPGVTVVPPGDVRPAGGGEYKVFTPYYRRWLAAQWRRPVDAPAQVILPDEMSAMPSRFSGVERIDSALDAPATSTLSADLIVGGEAEARRRLEHFARDRLEQYDARRDDLAHDGTSRLSAFLHFGCLSPMEVATRLRALPGGEAFVRQLCWRDFFHQVLAARPDAAVADYRPGVRTWDDDAESLHAWREGTTGYPLVDAAMRQLAREGFMHNRARMVVASFLCKDLALDWRLGAAHFMSLLADGDVANNQLNWQWVAGTGFDSNPHRIFNPVTQGRRYDPDGDYVRRYLPELAQLDRRSIHWPDHAARDRAGYPAPIVDHAEAIADYRARRRGDFERLHP
jgi:deoxyribodipyrimidine photo-lyase